MIKLMGATVAAGVAMALMLRRQRASVPPDIGAVELEELPESARQPRKLAIVGVSGAGKSHLAKACGARLGITYLDMDDMFEHRWQYRERTDDGSDQADLRKALKQAKHGWVVDGVFMAVRKEAWPKADLVVVLEPPAALRVWRVFRRAWFRGPFGSRSRGFSAWLTEITYLVWQASGLGGQRRRYLELLAHMQNAVAERAALTTQKRNEQRRNGQTTKTAMVREAVPVLLLTNTAKVHEWLESLDRAL